MRLNSIKPAPGAKTVAKRLGRGIGSGLGKTCGRGHKGQRARAGGYHKVGFEGGQMPLQRKLPKSGFKSKKNVFTREIYLSDLDRLDVEVIDLAVLIEHDVVPVATKQVKVISSGELTKKVALRGLAVTAGAREQIEKLNGSIEA